MKYRFLFTALLLLPASSIVAAENSAQVPTAEEIVTRMGAHELQRQASTEGYAGMRRYVLENHHFDKHSEILVRVRADQDGTKHFDVVSEKGWKAANTHVLRKMVESEAETSRPDMRLKTKVNLENYDFEISGTELVSTRPTYVLEVIPKRKDRYLFRGRIWVDAQDYALVRVEGSPAKNPSFWTKSTHFVQLYYKSGSFWFPRSTQSVTEARIFGTTDVSIEYFDYAPVTHTSVDLAMSAKVTNKP
jgi:outer membrane lipoprotein-sorting protein